MNWISDEDEEDFKQEQLIKAWLSKEGKEGQVESKYITRKGTARNTRVRASFSLDQKISEDSEGTFANFVAGSDGRDLYSGGHPGFDEVMDAYLYFLGFGEELSEWVIKTLRLSEAKSNSHLEKFLTDSEL